MIPLTLPKDRDVLIHIKEHAVRISDLNTEAGRENFHEATKERDKDPRFRHRRTFTGLLGSYMVATLLDLPWNDPGPEPWKYGDVGEWDVRARPSWHSDLSFKPPDWRPAMLVRPITKGAVWDYFPEEKDPHVGKDQWWLNFKPMGLFGWAIPADFRFPGFTCMNQPNVFCAKVGDPCFIEVDTVEATLEYYNESLPITRDSVEQMRMRISDPDSNPVGSMALF